MKKMKTILASILTVATAATCSVCLAACNDDNSTASSTASSNASSSASSSASTALTRTELAEVFKATANAAFAQLGFDNSPATTVAATAYSLPVVGEAVSEDSNDAKFLKANAIGNVGLINMIGELYENEHFVVTEDAVSFVVVYNGASSTLTLLPSVDKAANKVEVEIALDTTISGVSTSSYYYFDLDYNFATSELSAFGIHIYIAGFEKFQCQRMENGTLYNEDAPSTEYVTALTALKDAFAAKKTTAVQLTANFQTEFDGYISISQKAFQDAANSIGQ